MPPKAKFDRAEIVKTALAIVENEGFEALTARNLGRKLGSSSRPIFTVFKNMDEVLQEVVVSAKKIFAGYIAEGLKETPPFRGTGKAYIRFAKERPKLFQFMFMIEQEDVPDISIILGEYEGFHKIINPITGTYAVSEAEAEWLYRHLWVYCHGIATLIATKVCTFSEEQIVEMLSDIFLALLKQMKERK